MGVAENIERGGNELAELIPKVGQAQIRKMRDENDSGEASRERKRELLTEWRRFFRFEAPA